jgi:hypothetical protein
MSNTKTLIIESPKYGTFEVLYDAEDEDKISKHTWNVNKDGNRDKFYVFTMVPHPAGGWYHAPSGRQRRKTWLGMHRLIMNTPKGMVTDHINGNPLDNRKENLRICTAAENKQNRAAGKNNTSGFKGVSRHKRTNSWHARIGHNKKPIHIGCFEDKEEAARAYDRKAIELHGEFAQTNFPIEDYANIALQLL